MSSRWSSSYIYCHLSVEETDALIVEHVAPLAEALIASGKAEAWFFLRYWHGGPHLRVRFRNIDETALADFELSMRIAVAGKDGLPLAAEDFYAHFGEADPTQWRGHGDVIRAEYEPETARYGGPEALAVCEDLFCLSSRIAVGILACADRNRVFLTGIDLMMLAISSSETDDVDAVRSVRGYFTGWDFITESTTDRQSAVAAGEAMYFSSQRLWDGRRERLQTVVAEQHETTYARWSSSLQRAVAFFDELAAGSSLQTSRRSVLWSLVHMMNNRLGLSIAEERTASWLVSLAYPGCSGQGDFFPGNAEAADRVYLESSKYFQSNMQGTSAPRPFTAEALTARTARNAARGGGLLPFPELRPLSGGLQDALAARRSEYGDYGGSLAYDVLGDLLGHAVGAVGPQDGGREHQPFRTYPSPSSAYATEVFVLAFAVEGLEPGLYRYDSSLHALHVVSAGGSRGMLTRLSPFFAPGTEPGVIEAVSVPALVLLVSDLGVLRPRYGLRALRLLLLEAGHMSQNLALCAAMLGLKSVTISGYADDVINAELHLDGVDRTVSALLPIGPHPSPNTPAPATT